jgi:hypothetical protein
MPQLTWAAISDADIRLNFWELGSSWPAGLLLVKRCAAWRPGPQRLRASRCQCRSRVRPVPRRRRKVGCR